MDSRAAVPNKVFVGGIPKMTSEHELMTAARQFGSVKFVKIIPSLAKSSATFGFVSFLEEISAQRMIKSRVILQGQVVDCKPTQKYSHLKEANEEIYKRKVYIGSFSRHLTEDCIKHLLTKFGQIDQVVINRDLKSGQSRGSGFVIFKQEKVSAYVSNLRIQQIEGQRMIVLPCKNRGQIFKNLYVSANNENQMAKPVQVVETPKTIHLQVRPKIGLTALQLTSKIAQNHSPFNLRLTSFPHAFPQSFQSLGNYQQRQSPAAADRSTIKPPPSLPLTESSSSST